MKVMTHLKKVSVISEITLMINITKKGFDASSTFTEANSSGVIKVIKTLNINRTWRKYKIFYKNY